MSHASPTRYRANLAALWLSQCLHFFANYGLRIAVVFHLARIGSGERGAAFHLSAAIFMAPSIIFVPLYGALSNSLPKRLALTASAGLCAAVTLALALLQTGWLAALAVVALGSALYSPTRFALLPAAACDARWPLQRVLSAFETGSVLSMVGGMLTCGALFESSWVTLGAGRFDAILPPPPLAMLALAHGLSFLLAPLAYFPSDVRRPEAPRAALVGFGHDALRIWQLPQTRGALLGLASLRAIVTAAAGAFVASALEAAGGAAGTAFRALMGVAIASIVGAAGGALLAGVSASPRRTLRLAPLGVTGMFAAIVWAAAAPPVPLGICVAVGVCGGFVNVPLLTTYQHYLPADARGNGMAILSTAGFVAMTIVSASLAGLARQTGMTSESQLWIVAAMTGLAAVAAWIVFARTFASAGRGEKNDDDSPAFANHDTNTSPV